MIKLPSIKNAKNGNRSRLGPCKIQLLVASVFARDNGNSLKKIREEANL
jgi:hypothetical protein